MPLEETSHGGECLVNISAVKFDGGGQIFDTLKGLYQLQSCDSQTKDDN